MFRIALISGSSFLPQGGSRSGSGSREPNQCGQREGRKARFHKAGSKIPTWLTVSPVYINSIQCCGSGMFIPNPWSQILIFTHPGSRIQNGNKKEGWKKICWSYLFFSHKFHKTVNYFIFEMLTKKIWVNFQRNFLPQKIVTKLSKISPRIRIRNTVLKTTFRVWCPYSYLVDDPNSPARHRPRGTSRLGRGDMTLGPIGPTPSSLLTQISSSNMAILRRGPYFWVPEQGPY